MKKGRKEEKTGLRVVLDTNVYVSMFHYPQSPLGEIWRHAQCGTYELVISPAIVHELGHTLRHYFSWADEAVRNRTKALSRIAEIVTPKSVPHVIKDDPDDDHILACALAGRADLIVSGDRHLLKLKSYEGIGIVRPKDFLHTLGGVSGR